MQLVEKDDFAGFVGGRHTSNPLPHMHTRAAQVQTAALPPPRAGRGQEPGPEPPDAAAAQQARTPRTQTLDILAGEHSMTFKITVTHRQYPTLDWPVEMDGGLSPGFAGAIVVPLPQLAP